ncbi:hypothetical protein QTP70_009843 [Hemibagrus guttatus]|uniref:Uncharacterized protein n=1 Tax=Hemibagrus guttatus TaxID=175788 RepID=A0AAE0Q2A2_9TELE|nr:hypothetical protein QTP70_009843 [Hemibagrus guttatus]
MLTNFLLLNSDKTEVPLGPHAARTFCINPRDPNFQSSPSGMKHDLHDFMGSYTPPGVDNLEGRKLILADVLGYPYHSLQISLVEGGVVPIPGSQSGCSLQNSKMALELGAGFQLCGSEVTGGVADNSDHLASA